MRAYYWKGKLLSGIIYLHSIAYAGVYFPSVNSPELFQQLCGSDTLQNVLLTITERSDTSPVDPKCYEDRSRNLKFREDLVSKGASRNHFTGTRESGLELIQMLMNGNQQVMKGNQRLKGRRKMMRRNHIPMQREPQVDAGGNKTIEYLGVGGMIYSEPGSVTGGRRRRLGEW